MRLHMTAQAVSAGPPSPVVLTYTDDATMNVASYLGLGYTNYEVVCIGAAGGRGGGINPVDNWSGGAYSYRPYGGNGGGGGVHRVSGALSSLPSSVPIIVGVPGDNEPNVYEPYYAGDLIGGPPGGYSSFNGTTCRASGGHGGQPAVYDAINDISDGGAGGEGGIGGSTTPGGGGYGADPETYYSSANSAGNGGWDGAIGGGGGGGAGGTAHWDNYYVLYYPTDGGWGAFGGDFQFAGVAGSVYNGDYNDEFESWRQDAGAYVYDAVQPGAGGGANSNPVSGSAIQYGTRNAGSSPYGIVAVKLT